MNPSQPTVPARFRPGDVLKLILFWSFVGIPLAWGIAATLKKAAALFQ